jgi:5'-methylthioadenosine phosphorylase
VTEPRADIGIIGGTGFYRFLEDAETVEMDTPFGAPSGPVTIGATGGRPVAFLPRHGTDHRFPPHRVPYRANLWALKHAGADAVVSVASVGGIRNDIWPGTILLPHQVIDYTWGRASTFFEGPGQPVNHIDFTEPYSRAVRAELLQAAGAIGERIMDGAVYAATQGPRLETAAEINRLERDGADIVGMTGMPEASLAREIGLEYAAIAVVANYAAGRGDSEHAVPLDKIQAVLDEAMGRVRRVIAKLCEQQE